MGKFRKKPVVIEAVQWTGENRQEIIEFCGLHPGTLFIEIETLEGVMIANIGDWVIKGAQGEFYPCKPDIFEATYEALRGEGE